MKAELIVLSIFINLASALNATYPCKLVKVKYGYNCECTDKYCDTLSVPNPKHGFVFVTSSESGYRFAYKNGEFSSHKLSDTENVLVIDQTIKYEKPQIIGFGGTFTGTVSHIIEKLSPKLRQHFYKSCYSKDDGLAYNMMRVPIGGSDFDLEPWTYDNVDGNDTELLHFKTLDERDKVRNQQIKQLQAISENDDIKVTGASWTAPLWMKAAHRMDGRADNRVIPEFYETWANLHIKWTNLMEKDGIKIWCLSTGNEPYYVQNLNEWFVTGWNAGDQAEWIVNYLMPALKKSTNSTIKIQIYDDVRASSLEYLNEMVARHNDVIKHSDYIAIHGYSDLRSSSSILDDLYTKYDKQILYTEMSFGIRGVGVLAGSWLRAENLTSHLIGALQHNVAAYIDWNLMLNIIQVVLRMFKDLMHPLFLTKIIPHFTNNPCIM